MKNSNNNKFKEALVPLIILVLTLIFVIISLGKGFASMKNDIPKSNMDIRDVIGANYKTLNIQFYKMNTTNEEYKILRDNCDNFILKEDKTIQLNSSLTISENTYIDSNISHNEIIKEDTLYETGPIYLNDKLLMRYLNEKGEMKVATSVINRDIKNNVYTTETFGIDNLAKAFEQSEILDKEIESEIIQTDEYDIIVDEDQYIKDMSDIFIKLVTTSPDNIKYDLKIKSAQYFSSEGYKNIVNNAKALKLNNNSIRVVFAEAGKSSLDIKHKNRVVMQLEINSKQDTVYTTVIIKLNDKNKVFDIDII